MSDETFAGRKDIVVIAVSVAPDACVMPNGSIAFFDLVAVGTDAIRPCKTIRVNNAEVFNLQTQLITCSGDESGSRGVDSGTIKGAVDMLQNGCTVNSENNVIIRNSDPVLMNNKNTIGILMVDDLAGFGWGMAIEYGKAINNAENAKRDAREKKPKIPRNRKNRKLLQEALLKRKEALAKAQRLKVPGATSRIGKVAGRLSKIPVVDKALDGLEIAGEVLEGDKCGAAVSTTKALASGVTTAALTPLCSPLIAAGFWPGMLCAGVVIIASIVVGNTSKQIAAEAIGTDSCPVPDSNSPPPGPPPSQPPTPTPSPPSPTPSHGHLPELPSTPEFKPEITPVPSPIKIPISSPSLPPGPRPMPVGTPVLGK